jgi:xylitol oxidase
VKHWLAEGERVSAPATFYEATLASHNRPIDDTSDRTGTGMGMPGPWHERMPHFVFKDAERVGNELQSEYFVPRAHAVAAMKVVAGFRAQLAPILGVSEIRSVAADKLWLSPAYKQDIIGIHFNWLKDWAGVGPMLPVIEAALLPFQPRPHWGKLFALTPAQVQAHYPRLGDFRALCRNLDPQGKFRNAYVARYIFG